MRIETRISSAAYFARPMLFPVLAWDVFGRWQPFLPWLLPIGAALGIASIGFSRDLLGSFRPSMWALCGLTILAGLLFSRIGEYKFAPNPIQK